MIVAEQVAAALEGGLVTNAVNIPTVGADDLEVLGPYIPLAAKLGRFAMALGGPRRAPARRRGVRRARGLRHAPAHGRRAERRLPGADRPARELRERARRRRRPRRRGRRGEAPLVARLHRTSSRCRPTAARVAGTTIGNDDRHWLVSALGFELEMELAPRVVLLRYDDVPGVIGRVGTLFGDAGVNIANMAVSRNREGGKALMALTLDSAAPAELLDAAAARRRRRLRHQQADVTTWPEPVERVSRSCARRRSTRGSRSSPRHADGARGGGRRPAASSARSSSRSCSSATAPTCSRSSRATAAPTRRRSPRRSDAAEVRVARPDEVVQATGFEPGGVAPFPQRAITQDADRHATLLGTQSSGSAPAARRTWRRSRRSILQRLAGARPGRHRAPRLDFQSLHAEKGAKVQETEKIWMNGELVDWADAKVHVGVARPALRLGRLRRHSLLRHAARARRSSGSATTSSACTTRRACSTCRSRTRSTS